MRMLTLWQPWASLALTWVKGHETRGWAYPAKMLGDTIVVHAAASKVQDKLITPELEAICSAAFGWDWRNTLPRGAALGTVRLGPCALAETVDAPWYDRACGDWTPGRYVWALENPQPFDEPVPFKGKQGWGSYP